MEIITAKHARKLIRSGEAHKVRSFYQPNLNETYQVIWHQKQSKLLCYFVKEGKIFTCSPTKQ